MLCAMCMCVLLFFFLLWLLFHWCFFLCSISYLSYCSLCCCCFWTFFPRFFAITQTYNACVLLCDKYAEPLLAFSCCGGLVEYTYIYILWIVSFFFHPNGKQNLIWDTIWYREKSAYGHNSSLGPIFICSFLAAPTHITKWYIWNSRVSNVQSH